MRKKQAKKLRRMAVLFAMQSPKQTTDEIYKKLKVIHKTSKSKVNAKK